MNYAVTISEREALILINNYLLRANIQAAFPVVANSLSQKF